MAQLILYCSSICHCLICLLVLTESLQSTTTTAGGDVERSEKAAAFFTGACE
jgi:hypothetical protein